MRKYSFVHGFFLSFYSSHFYRDVRQNWGNLVWWYLLFIITICATAVTFKMQMKINRYFPPLIHELSIQAPEIHIMKGIVQTPENRPYIIQDPQTMKVYLIIDTSGKYTSLTDSSADMLLTQDKFMIKGNDPSKIKTYHLFKHTKANIIPEKLKKFEGLANWAWIVLFPIFALVSFCYRTLQGLFYALLGKALARALSIKLSYKDVLRLALVAITPSITMKTYVEITIGKFPFAIVLYFTIAMLYLIFAIYANKKSE